MARRAPAALASSMARSTAALCPEITTCPGALSLAAAQISPSTEAAFAILSTASRSSPNIAAIAPTPGATAFCIASPRSRSRRAVSGKLSDPAAASAEYSPRLCPATKAAFSASRKPPSCSSTLSTARLKAMIAGWAFAVSVRVGSGPSNMMRDRDCPSASSTS